MIALDEVAFVTEDERTVAEATRLEASRAMNPARVEELWNRHDAFVTRAQERHRACENDARSFTERNDR